MNWGFLKTLYPEDRDRYPVLQQQAITQGSQPGRNRTRSLVYTFAQSTLQMQFRRLFQAPQPSKSLCRTDGEYGWVLDNSVARFTPNEFAGYIGSCIDIALRIASESALRAIEELSYLTTVLAQTNIALE